MSFSLPLEEHIYFNFIPTVQVVYKSQAQTCLVSAFRALTFSPNVCHTFSFLTYICVLVYWEIHLVFLMWTDKQEWTTELWQHMTSVIDTLKVPFHLIYCCFKAVCLASLSYLENWVILSGVLCVISLQETASYCAARPSKLRQVQVSKAQLCRVKSDNSTSLNWLEVSWHTLNIDLFILFFTKDHEI